MKDETIDWFNRALRANAQHTADKCPRCGSETECDEADVGVGVIYGPRGCPECHWFEGGQADKEWRALEKHRTRIHRAALVRAVVARDWATMCAQMSADTWCASFSRPIGALTPPDEFVAELLGEKHDR